MIQTIKSLIVIMSLFSLYRFRRGPMYIVPLSEYWELLQHHEWLCVRMPRDTYRTPL